MLKKRGGKEDGKGEGERGEGSQGLIEDLPHSLSL